MSDLPNLLTQRRQPKQTAQTTVTGQPSSRSNAHRWQEDKRSTISTFDDKYMVLCARHLNCVETINQVKS